MQCLKLCELMHLHFCKSTESSAESHGNHSWCFIYSELCLGDVSQMDDCISQSCNNSGMMLMHFLFITHHVELLHDGAKVMFIKKYYSIMIYLHLSTRSLSLSHYILLHFKYLQTIFMSKKISSITKCSQSELAYCFPFFVKYIMFNKNGGFISAL